MVCLESPPLITLGVLLLRILFEQEIAEEGGRGGANASGFRFLGLIGVDWMGPFEGFIVCLESPPMIILCVLLLRILLHMAWSTAA